MDDRSVHPQLFPVIVAKALDNAFRAAEEVELINSAIHIQVRSIVSDPRKVYSLPDIEFRILYQSSLQGTLRTETYSGLDETTNTMKRHILEAIERDIHENAWREASRQRTHLNSPPANDPAGQ